VRKLAKPSVAAWAVNQLVRSQPQQTRALMRAGDALREAQAGMASGKTSAADVRRASEEEREAIAVLSRAARGLLSSEGRPLSAPALQKVGETLRAATVDDEARGEVAAGRVTRERQAVGLGPVMWAMGEGGAPAAPPKERARRGAEKRTDTAVKPDPPAPEPPARDERKLRSALRAAREDQRKRRRDVETAEDALEGASEGLSEAERALEAATRRQSEAEEGLGRAREALHEADERMSAGEADFEG
jgi:hypothetical protein